MGKGQRGELEAALSARIELIFDRTPGLCGFSIAERLVSDSAKEGAREWELYVSAVETTYPELSTAQTNGFIGEISGALEDLLKQEPQAADLLPGRTFARVWH
ncbi:MAG TPA: hypothetical protein VGF58_07120 [Burkholderiales bacterium]|jgi:hypothetical protein